MLAEILKYGIYWEDRSPPWEGGGGGVAGG